MQYYENIVESLLGGEVLGKQASVLKKRDAGAELLKSRNQGHPRGQ